MTRSQFRTNWRIWWTLTFDETDCWYSLARHHDQFKIIMILFQSRLNYLYSIVVGQSYQSQESHKLIWFPCETIFVLFFWLLFLVLSFPTPTVYCSVCRVKIINMITANECTLWNNEVDLNFHSIGIAGAASLSLLTPDWALKKLA